MTNEESDAHAVSGEDIGRLLPAVGQSWRRLLAKRLHEDGLSDATGLPILVLWRAAPHRLRQHELAQQLGLETSGVVRVLDGLAKRGLLNRVEDPSDRRAKLIELTEEGNTLGARVDQVARTLRLQLLQGLTREDLQATSRVLAHLVETLELTEADWKSK